MFHFLRRLQQFREQAAVQRKRQEEIAELKNISDLFFTLNSCKQAGLLYYDFKRNTVTIAQVLAEYFIRDNAQWQAFLHKCRLWAAYQYGINHYTQLYTEAKADEEARAYREKQAPLTEAERRLAKARAIAHVDGKTASTQRYHPLPDGTQFVVTGVADGEPIVVARWLNGQFVTASVGE